MTDEKALIVQGDLTLMLEVHSPGFDAARGDISAFSELEKSPEHIHTYKISSLSLWNAAGAGLTPEDVEKTLRLHSKYPIPENVIFSIKERMARYGLLKLFEGPDKDSLILKSSDPYIAKELASRKTMDKYWIKTAEGFLLPLIHRGTIKQELIQLGYPVQDMAPLKEGDPLEVTLKTELPGGHLLTIRDYQKESTKALLGNGGPGTGFGTIVLPCGAGKTVVGINILTLLKTNTLILTTNVAAVHQWIDELLEKTSLTMDEIGEYTGDNKNIKAVTVATYQVLVWRKDKVSEFPHFQLFRERNWGLIIYDEVHLLPAPVFRVTAELQAVRRVGLTATLVREDGAETNVFSLVGPKKYDVPWKELEAKGWIAEASCYEYRIALPEPIRLEYAVANQRAKYRIASCNPWKIPVVKQLVENHREDSILVIGQYLDQLEEISKQLKAPLITGSTPNPLREEIYNKFRAGTIKLIVVSKVANFAINLPDASVAIQVSGTFGSRQEEAQRLGRILRPKKKNSFFYTLVTRFSSEEEFAAHRQRFLAEQGYKYTVDVISEEELIASGVSVDELDDYAKRPETVQTLESPS